MPLDKKKIEVICEYADLLEQTISWYNRVYKTDFKITGYIRQEVDFAVIEYMTGTTAHVFELASIYGRSAEHKDKRTGAPEISSFRQD